MDKPIPRIEIGGETLSDKTGWWADLVMNGFRFVNDSKQAITLCQLCYEPTKERAIYVAKQFNLPIFYNGKEVGE